jgi:hypothetical protein
VIGGGALFAYRDRHIAEIDASGPDFEKILGPIAA